VGEWLTGVSALQLFLADWFPELVDHLGRIRRDRFEWKFEVLCPKA
jgi:hypothetical protein